MKQIRWHLCLTVFALALLALALPGVAAAAPASNTSFSPSAGSIVVDAPTQPTFAVPGIFSIKFGNTAGDAEIDLPSLNTAGAVSGLTIGQYVSWDFLSLNQKQPVVTSFAAISEAKMSVSGPQKGYTSEASAQIKFYPSPAFQTSGMFGFRYDGLKRSGGFMLQNVALVVAADPVHVNLGGVNSTDGGIAIEAMKVEVPAANASIVLDGYQVKNGKADWKALSIMNAPNMALQIGDVVSVSEMQASVAGPGAGYATTASANLKVNAGQSAQVSGKMGFSYDGMRQSAGFTLQNAGLTIAAEPVKVAVSGVNSAPGSFSIDAMKVGIPAAGADMTLSGYQVKNGKADWKALSIMNTPNMALQIGNVVSISEMQASVAGPGAGYATMASANLKVNAGQSAQVNGKVYFINDPASRQSGVALSKGNMAFQVTGWNLQMEGVNSIKSGVKIDTVSLAAEPLNLTAELTGVVVGDTTGFSFDQAKLAYTPDGSRASGFAMTVTRSNAGYVLTTTTVLPVAASK